MTKTPVAENEKGTTSSNSSPTESSLSGSSASNDTPVMAGSADNSLAGTPQRYVMRSFSKSTGDISEEKLDQGSAAGTTMLNDGRDKMGA